MSMSLLCDIFVHEYFVLIHSMVIIQLHRSGKSIDQQIKQHHVPPQFNSREDVSCYSVKMQVD